MEGLGGSKSSKDLYPPGRLKKFFRSHVLSGETLRTRQGLPIPSRTIQQTHSTNPLTPS